MAAVNSEVIDRVTSLANTIATRRCQGVNRTPKECDKELLQFVTEVVTGFRPSLAINRTNLKKFWEDFRKKEKITSFLLEAGAELCFRSGLNEHDWCELCDNLAHSLSYAPSSRLSQETRADYAAGNCRIVDAVVADRTEPTNIIADILKANKWVVFVILLTMCKTPYVFNLEAKDFVDVNGETK